MRVTSVVLWYHQEMSEQKSICSLFSLGKIEMLRSCSYCGKIHDKKIICPQKKNAIRKHQCKSNDKENKFRWSGVWKRKAEEIKKEEIKEVQKGNNIADRARMFEAPKV